MTHEEILKALYEVCVFLQDKEAELESKYGENPSFDSRDDSWLYEILMDTCHSKAMTLIKTFESVSGYKKAVGELKYHIGDGLKKAKETGQLSF